MSSGGNPCPPGMYCEYYFDNGTWKNIWSDPPAGYYCPADPGGTGQPGQYLCTEAAEMPSSNEMVAAFNAAPASLDPNSYCEYEFRDGVFYLTSASCPAGCFCPPDPVEYVKQNGTADMKWSHEDGRVMVRMTPIAIKR